MSEKNPTKKLSEDEIRTALLVDFPDAQIIVKDLTGTGDHWQVNIVSSKFADVPLVKQHAMVYESLADYMKNHIHALSLNTSDSR